MATGIKIVNDFGTILIDDQFPVLTVLAQGVSQLNGAGSAFIGDYGGKVAVRAVSLVGTQRFNYVDGYPAGIYLFGSPGETVEWWVFAEPQGAPSSVGLKIYNAAQQLMFDAGKKVARVVDLRAGPGNGNWQGNIGMPGGGRKWAVLPLVNAFSSVMTFSRAGAGGPDQYWQRENVSVAGGAVLGDTVVLGMTPQSMRQYGPYTGTQVPAGYTVASQNAAMAVMDMTGY